MAYKAVIFDLDGTLIHTRPECRYTIVGNTLKELGVSCPKKDIDAFWFGGNRSVIIENLFGVNPAEFWAVYKQYDSIELRKEHTEIYEDIEFLHRLREKGYKIGLVTGAPEHIAELEIGMIGKENFDAIVLARSSNKIKPKPDPHGIIECLRLLGIKKEEAVYVGNADEDIISAKAAQVFDILIERGEYCFENINPSARIASLHGLWDILNGKK